MKKAAAWILCLLMTALCAQAQAALKIAVTADLHVNPTFRYTNFVNPLEPHHLEITDAFFVGCGGS